MIKIDRNNRFKQIILFLVFGLVSIGIISILISTWFKQSSFFNVKKVTVLNSKYANFKFDYLKNSNIFELDLKSLEQFIADDYYFIDSVRISRYLPDRLIIQVEEKNPIARILLREKRKNKYYSVDKHGMLLPVEIYKSDEPVVLLGFHRLLKAPNIGKVYYYDELSICLDFIIRLKEVVIPDSLRLRCIDFKNRNNISILFCISSGKEKNDLKKTCIKVVFILKDINEKTDLLVNVLNSLVDKLNKIDYIDLRFNEPIVKESN
ncbi:MAG: FtsQ-type POTRA domain-containing protein [Candidatus Gygaella obscura]|nr:FtsQ-type POTRA domain-containing protein [Candidatus Gygaella obscura]